jgi:hypothetical protein
MASYRYGGPFGAPSSSAATPFAAEEVVIGDVRLQLSYQDEPAQKLRDMGVDVAALTEDVGGGLRRRWRATDSSGRSAWGRTRTEAIHRAYARAKEPH